jgi:peptidoglycan/xylan/chitin deacetylase (PgdA/CDA1 family)
MVNAVMWRALRQTGERCVFWSLQPEGRRAQSADAQAAHVVTRAGPGAIVDLHDAEGVAGAPARLAAGLPAMLDGLREAGYRLTTVTDLLADARPSRTAV